MSSRYAVRKLTEDDLEDLFRFCCECTQYYGYCGREPSRQEMMDDLHRVPQDFPKENKYYIGFFQKDVLVAVLDFLVDYPLTGRLFIGFFMVKQSFQGKGLGSAILGEMESAAKSRGISRVGLAVDRDNPQATHFWRKNGYEFIAERPMEGWTCLVAKKEL